MSTNTGTTTAAAASATEHRSTQSKRRLSWRSHTLPSVHNDLSPNTSVDPHAALMQGHDHQGLNGRTRHCDNVEEADEKKSLKIKNMMTPYLAQHIPQQYNPMGSNREGHHAPLINTKYCYRHRPNTLCRRQADEPSMEQLQEQLGMETQADQQSIANVWALFSAAPSRHRNLMLQGILAQCCFPQLSFISSTVRTLIKIDFLGALPTELGFKILCYLDTASLCSAAQVSQRWRQLADDDVVWHRMCEQHIDRKCTKCGWGLPLLDQRRLRNEKRRIQLRATGRGINEWSPELTPMPESANAPTTLVHRLSDASDSTASTKRSHPEDASSPESSSKRSRTSSEVSRDQLETYFDQPKKRPWKDVYKDRFKVGTNWKYGRYDLKVLKGHENGVMCLQFDDRTLITGSYDATVKVWDIETGQEIRTLTGHTQGIRCLQFDDSKLITGSLDRTMKVWNWRTGQLLRTITGHQDGVIGLHLEGKLLASGSADNSILIHDFNNYNRTKLLEHTDWVNSVKIDAKSNTLFSASDDMTVKLWDLETKECIATYEGHAGQVQQVLPLPHDIEIDEDAFPNNGRGDSYTVPSQTCFARFKRHSRQDPSVPAFFPDEPDRPQPPSWMLTGSLDGTVRLWNVPTGRVVCTFLGHIEGVWSLACDSLRLVTGAEDKMIKIWDPRTGGYERTLSGHEGPVTCVGLSDERVISGSEDGTVRIYCFNEQ